MTHAKNKLNPEPQTLVQGGTLAFIAAVLGQWVGTLLTIFVTNNFKVHPNPKPRQDGGGGDP